MTEGDLQRIEEHLDKFTVVFERIDYEEYVWQLLAQDFTALASDVRRLIEHVRARL